MSKQVSIILGKSATIAQPNNSIRLTVHPEKVTVTTDYQASEIPFVQEALMDALRTLSALANTYEAMNKRKKKR